LEFRNIEAWTKEFVSALFEFVNFLLVLVGNFVNVLNIDLEENAELF
jgi:hypothetical protein